MEGGMHRKIEFRDWLMSRYRSTGERGEIIDLLKKREVEFGDADAFFNRLCGNSEKRLHSIEGYNLIRDEWHDALRRNIIGEYSVRKYEPKPSKRFSRPVAKKHVEAKPVRRKPRIRPPEDRQEAVDRLRKRLGKTEAMPSDGSAYANLLRSLGLPL